MTKRVVLLASHGVQALDLTGPASVFSAANEACASKRASKKPPYAIEIVSPRGGLINASSGVSLNTVAVARTSPDKTDTLLIAGHDRQGTKDLIASLAARKFFATAKPKTRRWGSVCSGAFPLAAWGHLRGKKAATHWSSSEELARRYRDVMVDEQSLYVVDGKTWTSAGVTAGIDMTLAMVEADQDADIAAEIARRLVVYLRRPGRQSQFSSALKSQSAAAAPYAGLIEWARGNLKGDLSIERLAAKAGQSARHLSATLFTGRRPNAGGFCGRSQD